MRRRKGVISKLCSRCDNLRDNPKKRYCNKCATQYMKEWRKSNPLSAEQKAKAATRSYTQSLVKRGLLIKYPCEDCGDENVEAHHEDYSDPYLVKWLCFKCHRAHHFEENNRGKPKQMDWVEMQ